MFKDTTDKVKKSRYRTPTSCDQCRKRKLKCDRQRPCSNCVKSGTEDLCKYAPSAKSNLINSNNIMKINLNNEIIKLRLKINKLEKILEMNNIDISKYDNTMNESDYYEKGNFDDPMINLSEKFDSMMVKENKLLHSGTTSYVTFLVRDKQIAEMFEACSKKNILMYKSYRNQLNTKVSDCLLDSSLNDPTWLQFNEKFNNNNTNNKNFDLINVTDLNAKLVLDVLSEVNSKLPPLNVINALIDRFFKYVYPLLPFINEEIFRDELSYVLVPIENGGCKVSITHLQHTSIVSLLLVVLRYSYLTVNVIDFSENNAPCDDKYIYDMVKGDHIIDYSFIILSKNLLMALPSDDGVFKKITLRNIQVLLYLRLYQCYSPELNEEGRENSLTLALIIQMCRAVGANIDLENFSYIFKDNRKITVWRRIFYKLLMLDVHNAFEFGCPLIISDDEYGVKLPTLSKDDQKLLVDYRKGLSVSKSATEVRKLFIENSINNDIALEYDAVKLIRSGLKIFQNFKTSFKKSQFIKIVDKMQTFIDKRIPSLWEILQEKPDAQSCYIPKAQKIHKFEIRLTMQSILMTFNYLLYLNEENEEKSNYSSDDGCKNESTNRCESYQFTNKYGIKALELSLSILKVNHVYAKYMSQVIISQVNTVQHKQLKIFSANCEVFIVNRITISLLRPFLFLCSTFLKNVQSNNVITFDEVIQSFSNSVDSAVILKWFNVNTSLTEEISKPDSEFLFLLFQYIKDLFFMYYSLKDLFFICWRSSLMFKLFINYFKYIDNKLYTEFMYPKIEYDDTDILLGKNLTPVEASHYIDNDYLSTVTKEANSTGAFIQELFDTSMPNMNVINFDNVGNNLDSLIYNDLGALVEDMFKDSEMRLQIPREFDLFSMNQMNQMNVGAGNIIVTNIESMNKAKANMEEKFSNLVHDNHDSKSSTNIPDIPVSDINVFTDTSVADAIKGMNERFFY